MGGKRKGIPNNSYNHDKPMPLDERKFGSLPVKDIGYDYGLESILGNTRFETESNIDKRAEYMSSLPDNHPCEWKADFIGNRNVIGNNDTYFLLHGDGNEKKAIAAVMFSADPDFRYENIPFFYIEIECSWGRSHDVYHTWGRILWAYILYTINQAVNNSMFVVYNHGIPDAAGYHYKMGMRNVQEVIREMSPYRKNNDITKALNDLHSIIRAKYQRLEMTYNHSLLTNGGIRSANGKKWKNGLMFYAKKSSINYNDLKSIIHSLSIDTNPFKRRRVRGGEKKNLGCKSTKKLKKHRNNSKKRKNKSRKSRKKL